MVQNFQDTHQIQADGRYMVKLPRVFNPPDLGESRSRAIQRFRQNEKSLKRKHKIKYFNAVLKEYLDLDHAEPVPSEAKDALSVCYLPIHRVFKESSATTKVRAVFDASAKSTNGASLNDTLEAGPNFYQMCLYAFDVTKLA